MSGIAAPKGLRPTQPGKIAAIELACEQLGLRSFADLGGIGQVHGQYAFHAMEQPGMREGVIADLKIDPWTREQAAARGIRCVDGDFTEPAKVAEIGPTDAVFIFDVLVHTVDPDWDELLELYADSARCFVIANPQWQHDTTVRLLELGRERFLQAVPPTKNHDEIFDRLDEWFPMFGRPYRDAMHIWQWGITDGDLIAKMRALGFDLLDHRQHGEFWEAEGFVNTTLVFKRNRARYWRRRLTRRRR
jgi:hypothetical protein